MIYGRTASGQFCHKPIILIKEKGTVSYATAKSVIAKEIINWLNSITVDPQELTELQRTLCAPDGDDAGRATDESSDPEQPG